MITLLSRPMNSMSKLIKGLAALALGASLLAPSWAHAQAELDGKAFQDWTLRCGTVSGTDKQNCLMFQEVFADAEKQQRLLYVEVAYLPNLGDPALVLVMPLGFILQPGVGLQIDQSEPRAYPVRYCVREGCVAEILLDSQQVSAFRAGTEATVIVQNRRGQTVSAGTFSLSGFTAALKTLQEVSPPSTN
jgi:invasion protein IalB